MLTRKPVLTLTFSLAQLSDVDAGGATVFMDIEEFVHPQKVCLLTSEFNLRFHSHIRREKSVHKGGSTFFLTFDQNLCTMLKNCFYG